MLAHQDLSERISGLVIVVHKELDMGCSSRFMRRALPVRVLLNFNALRLKDGLRRRVRTPPGGEAAQQ
jgi:hypothetical protein